MKGLIIGYFVLVIIAGCCDDCHVDDPYPCNTVSLGKIPLTKELDGILKLDSLNTMTFEHKGGYSVNYKLAKLTKDSTAQNPCDTTMFFENWGLGFASNKTAPILFVRLSNYTDRYDSTVKNALSINLGTLNTYLMVKDSLISSYEAIEAKYFEQAQVFGRTFQKVYRISIRKPQQNEINGFYFSFVNGIEAFYSSEDDFWIRK